MKYSDIQTIQVFYGNSCLKILKNNWFILNKTVYVWNDFIIFLKSYNIRNGCKFTTGMLGREHKYSVLKAEEQYIY